MNEALFAQFGLDRSAVSAQFKEPSYLPTVAGRVAHIDADFLAYQVSAETKDELAGIKPRKSLEDMQSNARNAAEHLMLLAGADSYVCHITPTGSNKGGRADQAVQQEYQNTRGDRERPEFLDAIRHFIGQELNGQVALDEEADDGMATANWNAADPNLSVIISKDKDLRMVPGLHWCFDTEELVMVEGFGDIWIDDTKSSKTLKGWGTKFFWAQCLMGDTADAIKGIPAVSGRVVQGLSPSQAYLKVFGKWAAEQDKVEAAKLEAKLSEFYAKSKTCGPVLTYDILKDVKSDKEAFNLVKRLWQQLAEDCGYQFTNWKTGENVTPTQALLGDMQLLWMRRNKNPMDVVEWLKGN